MYIEPLQISQLTRNHEIPLMAAKIVAVFY